MDIKLQTACVTGHRSINEKDLPELMQKLNETVTNLVNQGIVFWLNGGACGFDHLSAQTILNARKLNPAIKLIMVLPCNNQDELWKESEKKIYSDILKNADKVIYVENKPYYNGCMKKRNEYLVEQSGVCVAYMKYERSGTSQTVRMAREKGLHIINLAKL